MNIELVPHFLWCTFKYVVQGFNLNLLYLVKMRFLCSSTYHPQHLCAVLPLSARVPPKHTHGGDAGGDAWRWGRPCLQSMCYSFELHLLYSCGLWVNKVYPKVHLKLSIRQGGKCLAPHSPEAPLRGAEKRAQPSSPGLRSISGFQLRLEMTVKGQNHSKCPDTEWLISVRVMNYLYRPFAKCVSLQGWKASKTSKRCTLAIHTGLYHPPH